MATRVGWSPGPANWKDDLSPIGAGDWNYDRAAHLLAHAGFGGAPDTHPPRQDIDPSHAFYLGYELAKAATALALAKDYRQDEALDWGYLTVPEESHRLRKSNVASQAPPEDRV